MKKRQQQRYQPPKPTMTPPPPLPPTKTSTTTTSTTTTTKTNNLQESQQHHNENQLKQLAIAILSSVQQMADPASVDPHNASSRQAAIFVKVLHFNKVYRGPDRSRWMQGLPEMITKRPLSGCHTD